MPRQFLNHAELERYQQLPIEISDQELIIHFSFSESDWQFINRYRDPSHRLGVALQAGTLRFLGFLPDNLFDPTHRVLCWVAGKLDVSPHQIDDYSSRANTRSEHLQAILQHTGFRKFSLQTDGERLEQWLVEKAMEHNQPILLLNMLIGKLRQEKIVQPGITVLERWVQKARAVAYQLTYDRLFNLLTQLTLALLDGLLAKEAPNGQSWITWLQVETNFNTPSAILAMLNRYVYLKSLGIAQWDLGAINPNRQKFLARNGWQASPQYLRKAPYQKRYPILACFLKELLIRTTDLILDMYDECIRLAHHRAGLQLESYQKATQKAREENTRILKEAVTLLIDEEIRPEEVRSHIYRFYPKSVLQKALVEEKTLREPTLHKHLGFLESRYSYLRQFVPTFLSAFDFQAIKSDDPFLKAIRLLRDLGKSRRNIPPDAPVYFIKEEWEELVFELHYDAKGRVLGRVGIHRKAYELCALTSLRDRLRSGNVFVSHSRRYANPDLDLMPKPQWESRKVQVLEEIGLPQQASVRLNQLTSELGDLIPQINSLLQKEGQLRSDGQRTHFSRLDAVEVPASAIALSQRLTEMLPEIDLSTLLIEVDGWLDYSKSFTHESGSEPRSERHLQNLYAILLANGCNMTMQDMARSAQLPYASLLWTQKWFIREDCLREAMVALVNYHHLLPISKHWGDGMLSSSDGQRFAVSGKIRNGDALPRYFGYGKGITIYTHTSDQYSQYSTKVIASTEREATYTLDAILDNETDLEIREHSGDTGAYTDLMFGLFDLLGIQLSLRFRDIVDQRLYKVYGLDLDYPAALNFMGRVNLEKISNSWKEILRVVGSLKSGWVTASLYISKLQAYPRQNKMLSALQEYGKLVKTIFILKYYLSESLQRRIHKQLNKGEALHNLRRFLFFGGDSKIRRKQLEDQDLQADCLNVLTNAVIVWTSVYMQQAIDQLRKNGIEVKDDDLAYLSPSRFEHINRYGQYNFDLKKLKKSSRVHRALNHSKYPTDNFCPFNRSYPQSILNYSPCIGKWAKT
jgi:TnpA family transposase